MTLDDGTWIGPITGEAISLSPPDRSKTVEVEVELGELAIRSVHHNDQYLTAGTATFPEPEHAWHSVGSTRHWSHLLATPNSPLSVDVTTGTETRTLTFNDGEGAIKLDDVSTLVLRHFCLTIETAATTFDWEVHSTKAHGETLEVVLTNWHETIEFLVRAEPDYQVSVASTPLPYVIGSYAAKRSQEVRSLTQRTLRKPTEHATANRLAKGRRARRSTRWERQDQRAANYEARRAQSDEA